MNKNGIIGIVVGVVIAGGVGYWVGMSSAGTSTSQPAGANRAAQFAGRAGTAGARFGGGGAVGKILSMDSSSITIQLGGPNASTTNTGTGSQIILVGSSTQVGKYVTGSATDLTVGDTVMVNGTSNSDGSLTAQMIQIRSAGTSRGQ
ncbi:MAG: hypothetical protein JWO50_144 [Candidatus Kaiserbacteria bacterium]|nr:hypothetical protein [Candidatus Kaiserbacteria bacterium]